jgi:AcrR family transcriptional regulator
MADGQRERILEATYACVARVGLRHTTMEDAAREAGLSRATVYRYFPQGRDQLIDEVITWEVARFFVRLAKQVGRPADVATLIERGLMAAHDALEHHDVLQQVLQTEADRLLPQLATTMPLVEAVLRDFFRPWLERDRLRPGVDAEEAAEFIARMVLSFIGSQGRWDLTDRAEVTRLVRDQLLAGVLQD